MSMLKKSGQPRALGHFMLTVKKRIQNNMAHGLNKESAERQATQSKRHLNNFKKLTNFVSNSNYCLLFLINRLAMAKKS